jgi:hypothetical protein
MFVLPFTTVTRIKSGRLYYENTCLIIALLVSFGWITITSVRTQNMKEQRNSSNETNDIVEIVEQVKPVRWNGRISGDAKLANANLPR